MPALVATNALRYDGAEAAKNESLLSWVLAQKAAFYKKTRPLRYTEDDEELLSPVPGYALPAGIEFRAVNEFAEAEPAAEPAAVAVEAEPAAEPDTA